jgi:TP901 family phage tail tape measure protein
VSDRSIILRLRAEVQDAITGLDKTAKAAEKVGTATEQASKKSKFSLDGTAASIRKNEEHYNRLGTGALVAGGLIATGIGFGVKAFADFDEAMSGASAALPDAGAEMGKLRQLAIDLGKDTKFSSTEAAQGITELAKAGVSAQDIYGGGLKGALDLAAAGGLEVGRAAEIAGIAVKQFNLEGADVPHVADLFSAAAGKAVGSVDDIAQAMKYAGITASSLGIGIEETTGVIGLFAEKGIIGEQAGTSFRSMLLSLTAPSKIAKLTMDELGISVFDSSGNFVGLGGAAEVLQQKLGPLDEATRTAALGQIFGNESIAAAIELYKAGGDGVADWTAKVDDAGFAAEQAAKLTDNLKGDIERFTGALDAVAVSNGGGLNGFLRGLVQNAEGAVESFGRLPSGVQQTVLGLGALTGAGLLAFGAVSKVVTSGANLLESLDAISTKSPRAASALGKVGKAAGILAGILAATQVVDKVFGSDGGGIGSEQLTRSLLGNADAVGTFNREIAAYQEKSAAGWWNVNEISDFGSALDAAFSPSKRQQIENVIASTGALGENQSGIARSAELFKSLDAELSNLATSGNAEIAAGQFKQFADFAAKQGISVEQLMTQLPQYAEQLASLDNEQKLAAGSGGKFTGAIDETGEAAAEAEADLKALVDQIKGFGSAADAAQSAESGFQAAIDDVPKTLADQRDALIKAREEEVSSGKASKSSTDALAKAKLNLAQAQAKVNSLDGKSTAAQKLSAQQRLEKATLALSQAQGRVNESTGKAKDLTDADRAAIEKWATAQMKKTDLLDLDTEAGRANDASLRSLAQAAKDATGEVFNLSGSHEATLAKAKQGRAEFIKAVAQYGITGAAAEAYADKLGLIPEDVVTAITAEGVQDTTASVLGLKDVIFRLDGKVVTVKEEGANPSKGRVEEMDGAIFGLKDKVVKVEELGTNASGERVVRFQGKIYALKGKTVGINVNTAAANEATSEHLRLLSRIPPVVSTTVRTTFTYQGEQYTAGVIGGAVANAARQADGGMHVKRSGALVQSFADGGRWDGSFGTAQPQIRAAGGAGIRWAEDGAGPWEAFISGHPAKADRSRMILEDTANRLGGQVQWLKAYAGGGIHERYATRPAPMAMAPSTPASITETTMQPVIIERFYGTIADAEHEAAQRRTLDKRGGRRVTR